MSVVPSSELETLRDWLRWSVSRFGEAKLHFGHGSDEAYDEAAYLLLHALHLPLDRLEPFLDAKLTQAERATLGQLFTRQNRRTGPGRLSHARGLARRFPLLRRRTGADPALVHRGTDARRPRSPTSAPAGLVQTALDMCTGSGCLAILLAHAYPGADVDAVDISSAALAVAQRNVSDYALADRINLIRSDLFANLPEKTYDLIISNPPYVTAMAMDELPNEYRHEPKLALAGGEDGLDAVREIVKEAPRFLNPGGTLVVELGHNRAAAELAFPRLPFVWLATADTEDCVFLVKREDIVNGR